MDWKVKQISPNFVKKWNITDKVNKIQFSEEREKREASDDDTKKQELKVNSEVNKVTLNLRPKSRQIVNKRQSLKELKSKMSLLYPPNNEYFAKSTLSIKPETVFNNKLSM